MRTSSFLLFLCWCCGAFGSLNAEDGLAFFEAKIRPVLIKHCYECHSATAAKQQELGGGLQLDTREGIRRGGDTGPAVAPGKPEQSLLVAAIRHEQDLKMPPDGGPLKPSIIADITKWIATGAEDPRDGKPAPTGLDFDRAREFWSLQPVKRPMTPSVADQAWPRGEIDRFVQARREAKGVAVVGEAPRNTLLRRLFFDVIGLPPIPQELRQFESGSMEQVVDYLLDSPHFGERWGRHWLDVARYAESNGRARNMAWRHAWRYRDWVIDAFNSDMPYDQFIAHQIAGDLLAADDREQRDRQTVATGFLALGPKSLEERNRELFRMDTIDEQIDVISRGILGLSVSCARCHDHKFDPIPMADYYALAGILSSTDTLYGIGPMGIKGVNDSQWAAIGPHADERSAGATEHLEAVKAQTQKRNTARSDRYRVVRRVADSKRKLSQAGADKGELEQGIAVMEAEIKDWDERIRQMDEKLAELVASPPPQPDFAMAARDGKEPKDCRIRVRGEPSTYGERVSRGMLRAIEIPDLLSITDGESGRLQLALWLSNRDNPLTARVIVNRIWLHLFGRGLVDTVDDFGATGSPPSHPLLLDYLAFQLMENEWSIKKLIREIVLSRTYQLSSESTDDARKVDPDNVFLWRMSSRRLEVEAFRDALLSVSGRLQRERPEGSVIQQIGEFSDYEFNFKTKVTPEMVNSDHRSIYLPVVRGSLPEMFQLFDFADPNALVGRRDQTTVPSQSLFLMNSPTMIDYATATAKRALGQSNLDAAQKIQWLYLAALARPPSDQEMSQMRRFLAGKQELAVDENSGKAEVSDELEAWVSACQAILSTSEFRHLK